jgi:hypothetical protein
MSEVVHQFEWSATPPSAAVVLTIAAAANREPTDLDPLYAIVEPKSLDRIVGSISDTGGHISFECMGYNVTIEAATGTVSVRELEESPIQ